MKFLDTTEFTKYEHPLGILYFKGYIANITIEYLMDELAKQKYPKIEGCFAFYWEEKFNPNWCACVDHFCTIPIFYTKKALSTYYWKLKKCTKLTNNEFNRKQMEFLGWFTVGSETFYNEILRVEPGNYLINNKQKKHIDIAKVNDAIFDKNMIRHKFEELVMNQSKNQNNVLSLSGGKDSVTLASIIKKLKIEDRFQFVSMHSNYSTLNEIEIVKKIEKDLNIEINYNYSDYSGKEILDDDVDHKFNDYWKEDNYYARHKIMKKYNAPHDKNYNTLLWTGEIGLGQMQSMQQISYLSQISKFDLQKLIQLHITILCTNKRNHCVNMTFIDEKLNQIKKRSKHEYIQYKEVYDYIYEYFKKRWETFETEDILNKAIYLRLREESAWRCFKASQDDEIEWFHPYADWDFISSCVSTTSSLKFSKNKFDKNLYRLIWDDCICKIPWEYPKIGLNIPQINKFRNSTN